MNPDERRHNIMAKNEDLSLMYEILTELHTLTEEERNRVIRYAETLQSGCNQEPLSSFQWEEM